MQPGGQFSNECDFAYGVPKRCDLAANLEDFTKPQTQVLSWKGLLPRACFPAWDLLQELRSGCT